MTQVAVSIQTGIDQSALSKFELGTRHPTVQNVIMLAQMFGTSVDYLLGLTDDPRPYPRKGGAAKKK
ncbi:MAG: helix-turn-helix transcriptional regulator [Clostridiales bacterium]|nr:helix-turn-helix transcriptional regulator [Clostridiales bacterium]